MPDTYAVWSKDGDIRYHSTSGGAFSEFAKVILADGGLVAGAKYNAENMVEHAIIDTVKGLEELRQSKYISSSPKNVYRDVKTELLRGKTVAFCGSPCQVAGLYAFLGKEYPNLITMDFICRGMNSPKAFRSWLAEVEQTEGKKVTKVWFKYKEGGWKTSPKRTRLDFADGSHRVFEGDENLFMHGYLSSNLYIRPCCGACRFKGIPRKSDITFADFWGIEKELDDDKGTSLLFINSAKGRALFDRAKDGMEFHQKDFGTSFAANPMFRTSVAVPSQAHDFLVDLDAYRFSDALKKYGGYPVPISFWQKAAREGKQILDNIKEKATSLLHESKAARFLRRRIEKGQDP